MAFNNRPYVSCAESRLPTNPLTNPAFQTVVQAIISAGIQNKFTETDLFPQKPPFHENEVLEWINEVEGLSPQDLQAVCQIWSLFSIKSIDDMKLFFSGQTRTVHGSLDIRPLLKLLSLKVCDLSMVIETES